MIHTKPGRPEEMQSGKRRNVYLDNTSWAEAVKRGNGNASLGIRMALACDRANVKLRGALL